MSTPRGPSRDLGAARQAFGQVIVFAADFSKVNAYVLRAG